MLCQTNNNQNKFKKISLPLTPIDFYNNNFFYYNKMDELKKQLDPTIKNLDETAKKMTE